MKKSTPQAVQACHELLRWLIPQLDKFPRVRRFTLGERLESILLEVLEATVESVYSRNKRPSLQRANFRLEVARDRADFCILRNRDGSARRSFRWRIKVGLSRSEFEELGCECPGFQCVSSGLIVTEMPAYWAATVCWFVDGVSQSQCGRE